MADDEVRAREALEEDDYDLLTYDEVDIRLRAEIAAQETRLAEAAGSPEAEPLRIRLEALREAAVRNARRPVNDETFERFFGFPARPGSR